MCQFLLIAKSIIDASSVNFIFVQKIHGMYDSAKMSLKTMFHSVKLKFDTEVPVLTERPCSCDHNEPFCYASK